VVSRRTITVRTLATQAPGAAASSQGELKFTGRDGKYAHAVFNAAKQGNLLKKIREDLDAFDRVWKETPQLQLALENPLMTPAQRQKIITDGVAKQLNLSPITVELLQRLLRDDQNIGLFADIKSNFDALVAHELGQVSGEITSAVPLTSEQKERAIQKMKATLKPGQTLTVTEKIDPTLLGGLSVRIGGMGQDLSARSRVSMFESILRNNASALPTPA